MINGKNLIYDMEDISTFGVLFLFYNKYNNIQSYFSATTIVNADPNKRK